MKSTKEVYYPVFIENQILSADNLNDSFDYLNEQELLARANLIGTGIISGLDVDISEKNGSIISITISKGCGITSDGHYVYLDEDKIFLSYKESIRKCIKVAGSERVYELFTTSTAPLPTGVFLLSQHGGVNFSDYIVTICCDETTDNLCSTCNSTNYTGSKTTVNIRILLYEKQVGQESTVLTHIKRKRLDGLSSVLDANWISEVNNSIESVYNNKALRSVLTKEYDNTKHTINTINSLPIYHDFFCDVIDAYEEFLLCAEKVLSYGDRSENSFPCHLVLNWNHRHIFQSTVDYNELCENMRWQWKRLLLIIEYFNPNISADPSVKIRLTPSVYGAVPLSEKAVPYYYKKTDVADPSENKKALDDLHKAWTDRKNKIGYWYGWYDDSDASASYLNYDIERYNFVRIEGHIDKPYTEETKTIKDAIKKIADDCHLPIEVIALKNAAADTCDLQGQASSFSFLQNDIQKIAFDIIKHQTGHAEAIDNINLAFTVLKKKVDEAANAAAAAAEKAAAAARVEGASNIIQQAAKEATDAAKEATDAAREATSLEAAEKAKEAVEKAKEAVEEAQKAGVTGITGTTVTTVTTVQELITLAAKTINAATALIATKTVSNQTDLVLYITKHYETNRKLWGEVISYSYKDAVLSEPLRKITVFLQWLDTTQMIYQQCEAKKVFSSFASFRDKHPGIQHKSGVPIGGTFILVYNENNTVIADFCLPYRVTQPD